MSNYFESLIYLYFYLYKNKFNQVDNLHNHFYVILCIIKLKIFYLIIKLVL